MVILTACQRTPCRDEHRERTCVRAARPGRFVTLSLFLALAATGCANPDTPSGAPGERVFPVHTAAVTTRDVRVSVDSVGTVYADGRVEIRPQVDGVVAAAQFEEGGRVRAGDELITIDDSKAAASMALEQARLDSARAGATLAAQQLSRTRRLHADQLVSREDLEAAEAEKLAAEAAVRENEAAVKLRLRELEDYHLRAPFDGTVASRLVDVGNYVERGAHLTTVVRTDPVEVHFSLPARYGDSVAVARPVAITDTDGKELATGEVAFIDPNVDVSTRMLRLEARIANGDGRLKPGQFVRVRLLQEIREQRVVIPEEAVVPYAGDSWVFVVDGERVTRREVTVGAREPGSVEITDGLSAGEVIVVSGQHRLSDEARIEVLQSEPTTGAGS